MKSAIRSPFAATLFAVLGATLVTYAFGWTLVKSSSVAHAFGTEVASPAQDSVETRSVVGPLVQY